MDIKWRKSARGQYIIEIWNDPLPKMSGTVNEVLLDEAQYLEINQWCIDTLKYHARTAYPVFELKTEKDLEWFLLRWS